MRRILLPAAVVLISLPLFASGEDAMRFPAGLGGGNDRMMTAGEAREAGLASLIIERKAGTQPLAPELGARVTSSWGNHEVVTVPEDELDAIKALLRLRPRVVSVSTDAVVEPPDPEEDEVSGPVMSAQSTETTFNDPQYGNQTYWRSHDDHQGASGIETAHGNSVRNERLSVVVVDGGFDAHPDLDWMGGISLVGDGRGYLSYDSEECPGYHGQSVGAIIGSITDNGVGMAGIIDADMYAARVLACDNTGYMSDVARAVRWAAGEDIGAGTTLETPAEIINLSLGGQTSCSTNMQSAIDTALAAGATVVVSAGNSSSDASTFAPANCEGVVTVGANTLDGDQTSFTNYGDQVEVSALGQYVWTQGPGTYRWMSGTSFSAPIVSGITGLLRQDIPEASAELILDLVVTSTTSLRSQEEPMGGVLNGPLLQANAAALLDPAAAALQHPARARDLESDAPHWEHLDQATVCGLREFAANDLEREEGEFYAVFSVPEDESLTTENATLDRASTDKQFLLGGIDPETRNYGVQLCEDADGSGCRSTHLMPLNLDLIDSPAYCGGS